MMDDLQAKAGRKMFIFAWLILFALLFSFFYYYGQQDVGKMFIQHGAVTINADRQGHYWLDGFINDQPVKFMVDTGATYVAIPKNIAQQLHLQGRYPVSLETANGEVSGLLTRVNKLSFAEFQLSNIKAVIIPSNKDDTVLLGMNVLSQFNLVQEANRLIIKK